MMVPAGFEVLLICLPLAAAAAWVAGRIGVPYPVLLVGAGVLLGLAAWTRSPDLAPDVVFFVFLPPLIYYAAYFISPADLRANARPIGFLAIGLVVVTTAAVAGAVATLAPDVPLGVAAVLGAVVAPTDAVAATTVFRRLGVSERLVTIIEGEGLINDGAALVLYSGAVAAVLAQSLRPGSAAITLLIAPLGGVALGLGVAWVAVGIRRRLDDPLGQIAISLGTPYVIYVLAQTIGLSGILATVAAGVYVGSRTGSIYLASTRLQAFAFLDVLVFLLNSVLFTLVGIQLARVVHRVPGVSTFRLVTVAAAVIAIVVGGRLVWMLCGTVVRSLLHHRQASAAWREQMVLGWAGMRGSVSLAAALALPLQLPDGALFPYRDLVIVVTAAVVVVTLVVQGGTLPWLLRTLVVGREDQRTDERLARLQAARAALARLDDYTTSAADQDSIASLRELYTARVRRLKAADRRGACADQVVGPQRYRALRLEMLAVERSVVAALRQQGRISATVLRVIERSLDLEETRLRGA